MRRPGSIGQEQATAMMVALLRPQIGKDAEFNWWYDTEHAPILAGVPGFLTARRYQGVAGWDGTAAINSELKAMEESEPRHYLAYYDLDDASVLDSPAYLSCKDLSTPNEREILASLKANECRVYRVLDIESHSAKATDLGIAAPFLMFTTWKLTADGRIDFERWYQEEHVPMLMSVPGWLRIRLFERMGTEPGHFLAMHDVASLGVFDDPIQKEAASTPWRTRATVGRSDFQRRLFRHWRTFDFK